MLRQRGIGGEFCVLYIQPNDESVSRFTAIASRAVGKAVERNRAKRRLREVYRCVKGRLKETVDIVVRAKPDIKEAAFSQIKEDVIHLLIRKSMIDKPDDFSEKYHPRATS